MTTAKTTYRCAACGFEALATAWVDARGHACPCCACRCYFDITPWCAWCCLDGQIGMSEEPPEDEPGCLNAYVFARGPRDILERVVAAIARPTAITRALLVPGMPEAGPSGAAKRLREWVHHYEQNTPGHGRGVSFGLEREIVRQRGVRF